MGSLQDQRARELWTAVLPAVCSAMIPGLGQLMSGRRAKALRLFCIAAALAAGLAVALSLDAAAVLRPAFAIPIVVMQAYGAIDAFRYGRNRA